MGKRRLRMNSQIGAIVVSRYTKSVGIVIEVTDYPFTTKDKVVKVKWQNSEITQESASNLLTIDET
jgi:hypothetical protein